MDGRLNLILTDEGLKFVNSIFERHTVIEKFLKDILNIDEKTAHSDSCRLEHSVSSETLNKIKELCDRKAET